MVFSHITHTNCQNATPTTNVGLPATQYTPLIYTADTEDRERIRHALVSHSCITFDSINSKTNMDELQYVV